jgi:transposase
VLKNFRALGCFLRHAFAPAGQQHRRSLAAPCGTGTRELPVLGNEQSGHDFAALYTLVASCEKHRVNAIVYLTDVLLRVQRHCARDVEQLLPHRWKPPD